MRIQVGQVGLACHVALSLPMWLLRYCERFVVCCYAAVWPAHGQKSLYDNLVLIYEANLNVFLSMLLFDTQKS